MTSWSAQLREYIDLSYRLVGLMSRELIHHVERSKQRNFKKRL